MLVLVWHSVDKLRIINLIAQEHTLPMQNGAAADYPDGKDGANAWIKQWRQKQKA